MSAALTVAIAIVLFVVLAALFFATAARRDRADATGLREAARKDRSHEIVERLEEEEGVPLTGREVERAALRERTGSTTALVVAPRAAPPAPWAPMDPEAFAVTRRQFFNRGITTMFTLSLAGFGAACLGFVWPVLSSGFGAKIKAGKLDDLLGKIASNREPVYLAEGRTYISAYPVDVANRPTTAKVYTGDVLTGMKQGVVALYQKCVHLGCRVPWCKSSQWFECPCHGSKYNRVGEKKGGPAPRGLDRFAVSVDGGIVVVDTKQVIQGPVIGTNTTGQEQEGPHCS